MQRVFLRLSSAFAALLAVGLASIPAAGQRAPQPASSAHGTPAEKQSFEVASIRIEDPRTKFDFNSDNQPWKFPTNRLTMRHITLKSLISMSFEVGYGKVLGGPIWLDQQHYDLNAKVNGDALLTQEQMWVLVQNLLEERFHLKTHREQKVVPGYALVVAKGGPRLQPTKGDPFIGINSGFELNYKNDTVSNFGKAIGVSILKQEVVDKTGIQGNFDFDLKFVPDDGPLREDPRGAGLPDIFTAVQQQLGLRLVPQKVTVDMLFIDHVDRVPTEN